MDNNHIYILLLIICSVFIILYIIFQLYGVRISEYSLVLPGLSSDLDGFTILHLSDLHNKRFGKNQSHLFHLINQQDFDIIALTGDMISKHNPKRERLAEFLQQLNDPANKTSDKTKLFVYGNHELWLDRSTDDLMLNNHIHILFNDVFHQDGYTSSRQDHVPADPETAGIWFIGVDDPHRGDPDLASALQKITKKNQQPVILLAHAPAIISEAAENNIDLVLTGHTHGGQVRLPLIGALYAPGQSLFPKYSYGLYQSGRTAMIINGGLGESNLPLRFANRPEIVLIHLHSASDNKRLKSHLS